jgi:hypothetical protein
MAFLPPDLRTDGTKKKELGQPVHGKPCTLREGDSSADELRDRSIGKREDGMEAEWGSGGGGQGAAEKMTDEVVFRPLGARVSSSPPAFAGGNIVISAWCRSRQRREHEPQDQ